jgi:hypothetical protein
LRHSATTSCATSAMIFTSATATRRLPMNPPSEQRISEHLRLSQSGGPRAGELPVLQLCLASGWRDALVQIWDSSRETPLRQDMAMEAESGRGAPARRAPQRAMGLLPAGGVGRQGGLGARGPSGDMTPARHRSAPGIASPPRLRPRMWSRHADAVRLALFHR